MSRVWRIWSVLVLFALGTSLITPLIPIYQEELGFSDTVATLFLGCYVAALLPSMLTLGQVSDRIGRKGVLLGALGTLAIAQAILITEPGLAGLLIARAIQGFATGAFFGTCTAFIVDAAPLGRRGFVSVLASVSVRLGLGLGPGLGGVIAQYSDHPLRLPFELHLLALALAIAIVLTLPETVTVRSRRPLTLRLEVPAAERAVFWRVLVPSGALFSLFDGTALSLIPVFLVRTLEVDNYALVGAAGFLVLVSGALSQLALPRITPARAIGWGLVAAAVASLGVVASAPAESAPLALIAVSATGAAAGLVLQGRHRSLHADRPGPGPWQAAVGLLRRLLSGWLLGAPAGDRAPLGRDRPHGRAGLPVGRGRDRRGMDLGRRAALALGAASHRPRRAGAPALRRVDSPPDGRAGVRSRGPRGRVPGCRSRGGAHRTPRSADPRAWISPTRTANGPSARASRPSSPSRGASGSTSTRRPRPSRHARRRRLTTRSRASSGPA